MRRIRDQGVREILVQGDVSSEQDVVHMVGEARERLGGLDILVNNAGILNFSRIEDTSEEEWDSVVAVNQKGVWLGMKTAVPAMRKRGELRPDSDPRHLARVLVVAHQGGSLLTQTTRSVTPLRDSLNAAVRYVACFATESVTLESRRPTRRRTS